MARNGGTKVTTKQLVFIAGLYGLFVLYLHFLPFTFEALSLDEWWGRFLSMPWLAIGVAGRADWIANLFLFVPFGFLLGMTAMNGPLRPIMRAVGLLVGASVVVGTAVFVEGIQILSTQRTVSQNDVLAAIVGGWLGLVVAAAWGPRLLVSIGVMVQPSLGGLVAGIWLYLLAYLTLAPFPYDFLVTSAEFSQKLGRGVFDWWLALGCHGVRCPGQLGLEVVAMMPLGALLILTARIQCDRWGLATAFFLGALVGLAIEILQFLTFSGISQGASIATRGLGSLLGAWLMGWLLSRPNRLEAFRPRLKGVSLVLLPVYLLAILAATNLLGMEVRPIAEAVALLSQISFIPFYYHYFTQEVVAMASLLYTLALYAPVGLLLWGWLPPGFNRWPAPAVAGILIALGIETGKLFGVDLRPDPTNVLLASCAATLGWLVAEWVSQSLAKTSSSPLRGPISAKAEAAANPGAAMTQHSFGQSATAPDERPLAGNPVPAESGDVGGGRLSPSPAPPFRGRLVALPLVLAIGLAVAALFTAWHHPLAAGFALAGVFVYGGLILRWPRLWLVLVPATLPVLDLTPWTGRLYIDEWDLLVLTTLAALFLRWGLGWSAMPRVEPVRLGRAGRLWLFAFLVSYAAAVVIALWPPAWPDALTWTSLHSPYNALRLAKGVLWALLLWPFFFRVVDKRDRALHLFSLGMVLGLTAAVISVLWERAMFPGLFDFGQHYRVVGLFSATHTGGAYLEGYLVTAVPFLAMALFWRPRWLSGPVALLLFVLAAYAVAVTYARAGYGGLLVAGATILVVAMLRFGRTRRARMLGVIALLVATSSGLVVLNHVQQQAFMAERVDAVQIDSDWRTRTAHWRESLEPLFSSSWTTGIGLGVGRFPELNFWESVALGRPVPAMHHLVDRNDANVLVLLPGGAHYVWQDVAVAPETAYRVQVTAQTSQGTGRLRVALCEQWILYSRRCVMRTLTFDGPRPGPSLAEATLTSRDAFVRHGFAKRPTKFIVFNGGRGQSFEVTRVSLLDPMGNELMANGDFMHGTDRWFFTSDDHLAWNIDNLWAQVAFEQGMVGLVAWTLLVMAALWGAVGWTRVGGAQGWFGAVLLAALLGFLAVGVFGSLFNSPRLATLFFLLVLLALAREVMPQRGGAT